MLALPARGKNADRAEELFRSATAPGVSIEEKARLLEESLAEARSYTAAFELGRTYNSLGMPEKAIIAFEQAAAVTLDPAQKSNALTIVARLYKATGDTRAAAEACRRALGIQSSTEVERELRDLEKENSGTVEAAEIAGTLKRGLAKRSLGVQPSIDLRVTFALDSARLSSEGVRQVNELGKALADSSFASYRIKLVGHTDKRGSDPYNDKLSRQRAEAVKEYLVRTFGITPARLLVEGKGKRELLFMGDDEEDHALNRRVEVVLVE
jgi:outer membrane protein OmpA-like peptidoglycan-associated protein